MITVVLWRAFLVVVVWTLVGLFFGTRLLLSFAYSGRLVDWRTPFLLSLLEWYGWAIVMPLELWINRRLPLNSNRWYWAVSAHLPLSLIVSLVKIQVDHQLFLRAAGFSSAANATDKLHANVVTYWVILGVIVGLDYYRRYKDREASLIQARLTALNMQLHPHFLFNTLNTVVALMHRDIDAAEKMLARLGELLRVSLDSGNVNETTLRHELEVLDRYLAIEALRFADRLRMDLEIAPETLDALVPSFMLQPLVENAIRHGIAASSEEGSIQIRSAKKQSRLVLEIRNSSPAANIQSLDSVRKGIGLGNTKARLEQLYGSDYQFSLHSEGASVVALIEIPFHA